MNAKYEELKRRLAEVQDLRNSAALLGWDQQTMMPPRGAAVRAEQLGTLERVTHELFCSDEIGRLLEDLREVEEGLEFESDEASLIRVARRDYEKARKVPAELRAEIARAGATALPVWAEARRESDFSRFLPYLRKNVELAHRYVECMDGGRPLYDILLDDYEEGITTEEVRGVFDELKRELPPLIEEAREVWAEDAAEFMRGPFAEDDQHAFSLRVIERFGFNADSWRLDRAVHPFASGTGTTDIRLTTRYSQSDLTSLFSAMHECGHGLYENGVSPSLERTLLASGTSLGFHESQSRMWENLVGRSRPFWRFFYPELQRTFRALAGVEEEAFYREINRIEPTLIRVDSDEVTYNLHIILRFELEQELMSGAVDLAELPEAWNARMKEYLAVDVPDDAMGVLQDVHWSGGSIGYFPTYSLGNVISLQLWERALADMPDLHEQFEAGEFGALRDWLRENVHRHGRKFTPKELLERVVGGGIDSAPYLRYLKGKLSDLAAVRA